MRRISPEKLAEELENREIDGWHWSKNNGGYHQKRDFFTVHWEVQKDDRDSIRLHVESPVYKVDPQLNVLKQEIISAILVPNVISDLEALAKMHGFQFKKGTRISAVAVQNNRSTEPCRVIFTDDKRQTTIQQDIAVVHEAMGSRVGIIVQQFTEQIKQHFPEPKRG